MKKPKKPKSESTTRPRRRNPSRGHDPSPKPAQSGSPEDFVLYRVEPPLAWITLNRPGKMNALAGSMREDLLARIQQASGDPEVRCLVFTGAGDAFCSGGDVSVMAQLKQRSAGFEEIGAWLDAAAKTLRALSELPKPSLACVNGVAAGAGLNLALACDFRIASEGARFGESFIRVGLHPDWGGTYTLPRLVGPAKALEMFTTGDLVSAEEALHIGLVNRVVPADRLVEETRRFASRLAAAAPVSFLAAREAVRRSLSSSLAAMAVYERHAQQRCWDSEDSAEGIRAFLEKRSPRFKGR